MTVLLAAVRAAYGAGLCVLPTRPDGSKAPDCQWRTYQTTRPTIDTMRAWDFAHRDGFGVVAGPVSGFVETWDFDCGETFAAFVGTAAATGLGAVVQRIRDGYEDATPGGGRRWLVRYPPDVTWQDCVLARRPGRDGEPNVRTLIELTTFAILAPSNGRTHPSGGSYSRVSGGFDSIASYSVDERDALVALARTFDAMPRREAEPNPPRSKAAGHRPGDDFNLRATWPEILPDWTHVGERHGVIYLRRPGKDHGISATINARGTARLHVFTSSTAFDPDTSYSKFGAYATLHHGGDYARAALALSKQGYGDRDREDAGAAPDFARPAVVERTNACILGAKPAHPYTGWFMRGGVHLVAGSSGAGKTTLMLDALQRQAHGEVVLGHVGGRYDFLVVFADRGKVSNDETLARMRIAPGSLPMAHVPPVPCAKQAVAAVVAAIEAQDPLPAVVFIEGADLLVEDACKTQIVAPFMAALRAVAEHYHLAVVLSVGAPKVKPQEQYALKRDQVFGSQAWSRLANDVLVLSITGDGSVPTRDLVVLHRNAGAETFHLAFEDGRLVEADPAPASDADYVAWFREAEVFLAVHFRRRFGVSGARAAQLLDGYVAIGVLREKLKNDRTYYVYRRATAAVSTSTVSADTVSPLTRTPDTCPENRGRGHDPQGETRDFPNHSEARQQNSLIPLESLSTVHTSLSSLSSVDSGHEIKGYTRARETGGASGTVPTEPLPDLMDARQATAEPNRPAPAGSFYRPCPDCGETYVDSLGFGRCSRCHYEARRAADRAQERASQAGTAVGGIDR
jgi:hypothetical protein